MKIYKIILIVFLHSEFLLALSQLQVLGEPGLHQYNRQVKAYRCVEPTKSYDAVKKRFSWSSGCDKPIFFELNRPIEVLPGNYIVGFENSIFPGFVEVKDYELKTIELIKLEVPKALKNEKKIKVYRDFSIVAEQQKLYFQYFYLGKHFFRMTNRYSFGDYYLPDPSKLDILQRVDYKFCNIVKLFSVREHAQFVCDAWNSAESFLDLADLFRFDYNGTFQEAWPTHPGDVQALKHGKHLVSAPISGQDFVSVFPGGYIFHSERLKRSIPVYQDELPYLYPEVTRKFHQKSNKENLDHQSNELSIEDMAILEARGVRLSEAINTNFNAVHPECRTARVWRTEFRSYCTSDSEDGCSRTDVAMCEVMKLDLRFRK